MAAYISESHRYFRLAKKIRAELNDDNTASYSVVGSCASYLESVANDVIFSWQFNQKNGFSNFTIDPRLQSLDIHDYKSKMGPEEKWTRILYPDRDWKAVSDEQLNQIEKVIRLRNRLVHLQPTEQVQGLANNRGPESVLSYLYEKRIVEDPNAPGVYWPDVVTHKVSDWAIELTRVFIGYAYERTFFMPFGIKVLHWESLQLG